MVAAQMERLFDWRVAFFILLACTLAMLAAVLAYLLYWQRRRGRLFLDLSDSPLLLARVNKEGGSFENDPADTVGRYLRNEFKNRGTPTPRAWWRLLGL